MNRYLQLAAVLTAAFIAGCGESTLPERKADATAELDAYFGPGSAGSKPPSNATADKNAPKPIAPIENDPAMDWADPCSMNLEEMVGTLLVYYSRHESLPPSIDQIPKTSPTGERISLSCPDSGKPYVDYPKGIHAPPEFAHPLADGTFSPGNTLILVDSVASHQIGEGPSRRTVRLGILMEPQQNNRAVQMYVVPLEENILQMYLRNARATGQ